MNKLSMSLFLVFRYITACPKTTVFFITIFLLSGFHSLRETQAMEASLISMSLLSAVMFLLFLKVGFLISFHSIFYNIECRAPLWIMSLINALIFAIALILAAVVVRRLASDFPAGILEIAMPAIFLAVFLMSWGGSFILDKMFSELRRARCVK